MDKNKKYTDDMKYYQENDNLNTEEINKYMKLSVEELDKLIAEEFKKDFEGVDGDGNGEQSRQKQTRTKAKEF